MNLFTFAAELANSVTVLRWAFVLCVFAPAIGLGFAAVVAGVNAYGRRA